MSRYESFDHDQLIEQAAVAVFADGQSIWCDYGPSRWVPPTKTEVYLVTSNRSDGVILDCQVFLTKDLARIAAVALWQFHNRMDSLSIPTKTRHKNSDVTIIGYENETRVKIETFYEGEPLQL